MRLDHLKKRISNPDWRILIPKGIIATTMITVIVCHAVQAQTTSPSSGSAGASAALPTSSSSTSQNSSNTAPIGGAVAPYSAAVPQPNPNLANNAALPSRRGYFRSEPFYIYPFIGMGFGTNSNLGGTSGNRISSPFWVVTPRLDAVVRDRGNTHSLSYTGNFGWYTNSSADNFQETELVASTETYFTSRTDAKIRAYYLDKSDPRGNLARPESAQPDRWHGVGANGVFGYGAQSAQGRIEVELGSTDKRYTNNRDITSAYDLRTFSGSARFLYRLAPRTRALAEIGLTKYGYSLVSAQNNNEMRYLVGATWDAAATTSGTVKLGWMTKDFSDPGRKNYSGASGSVGLRWAPLTYSVVDVVATRGAVDSFGVGIYSIDTSVGAVWNHQWRDYLSSRMLISRTRSVYQGIERRDDFTTATLGGYFDPRRWLRLGLEYSRQQRSSTTDETSFSRNVFSFTVGLTI